MNNTWRVVISLLLVTSVLTGICNIIQGRSIDRLRGNAENDRAFIQANLDKSAENADAIVALREED